MLNFDWNNLKANHIFSLLNSFKPTMGHITSVKVYKSEFGKKQMALEYSEGPVAIWKNQNEEE